MQPLFAFMAVMQLLVNLTTSYDIEKLGKELVLMAVRVRPP